MKNILTLCTMFLLISIVSAQENDTMPSSYFIGGSVNFQHYKVNYINSPFIDNFTELKQNSFSMQPYFGKMINPKLGVGVHLAFVSSKATSIGGIVGHQEQHTSQYGLGVFTRHILNPGNKLLAFVQPSLSYYAVNRETSYNSDPISADWRGYTFVADVNAGALYHINNRFRATINMGLLRYYNSSVTDKLSDENEKENGFQLKFNLSSINFGLEIIL